MKFLVVQQKMIGDVLASTVICESLKFHFPGAEVHLVANENTLAVLEGNSFVDEVIIFKNEYRSSKIALYRFLRSLKKIKYHSVFDAYGKLESNLITYFVKADCKIGNYKWYTSWIYSKTIHQKSSSNGEIPLSISNRLMLLDPVVKENKFITYPKIYLSDLEIKTAQEAIESRFVRKNHKLLMVSILGSSIYKTYPAKYMAAILDTICKKLTAKLIFNYIPKQREEALEIYNHCSIETQKCIDFDFYAKSLRSFMGLLSQCDLLIGNEGGAVNMAKALEIPSFSIFSPFIRKEGWHAKVYKEHESVHLRDYHPELFGTMNKNQIKENSAQLYEAYKPELFQDSLHNFLIKNLE